MGTSSPLEIPGLLSNVLRFCDDGTLFHAAQVNSVWAEHATNWLWRGQYRGPSERHACALQVLLNTSPSPARLNWYTRKTRYLDLQRCHERNDLEPVARALETQQLIFSRLKSAIADLGSEDMNETVMAHLLSPNLVTLELYGGYYTTWFLDQIQKTSPCLRYFLVDNTLREDNGEASSELNAADFRNFLEGMSSLSHLELRIDWDMLVDSDFWPHAMSRPNLEFLSYRGSQPINWLSFAPVAAGGLPGEIFPSLRFLNLEADVTTLKFLLPNLPLLQGVTLVCSGPFGSNPLNSVLESLTFCPLLEEIDLEGDAPVTCKEMLDLASSCPLVRILKIDLTSKQQESCFDNELFNTFVRQLKHLDTLQLRGLPVELSCQSLFSVASHCPGMRKLRINANVDLKELEDAPESVCFPRMEALLVAHVYTTSAVDEFRFFSISANNSYHIPSTVMARVFDPRFPLLRLFASCPTGVRPPDTFAWMLPGGLLIERTLSQTLIPADLRSRLIRALHHPIPGSAYNSRF